MPLNEPLFELLQSRFPVVKIVNEGQPRIVTYIPDPVKPGKLLVRAYRRGEQYAVDCRFCGDRRQRLYISYQYGQRDRVTGTANNLWCCHNERCHESAGNRALLRSVLTLPLSRRARQRYATGAVADTTSPAFASTPQVEMSLPNDLWPLVDLPSSHSAISYVLSRGFQPAELWRNWQAYYCCRASESRPAVYDRLIIPVWRPAVTFAASLADTMLPLVLAGWQARAIGPAPDHVPRYLSAAGMQKSRLLYGLPQALQTAGPVFVCEGVTDCWRIGPWAVALFGKDLSQHQKILLVHHFPGRPLIVALDADARDQAQQIVDELRQARTGQQGDNRVVLLELPRGRNDPGECTQEEVLAAGLTPLGNLV
ncbi:MAG TPA: hypothetical protein VHV55_05355 [Pirellulales bacterium]|jgi:hypothetical protein|nr:hypothetical protein [Pirellulales bacterium]